LKAKVYLSDEGYGHIVRQRAIMSELSQLNPDLQFTLQTEKYFDFAQSNIEATEYIRRYNNVTWHKLPDGSPDLDSIREFYGGYLERKEGYLNQEMEEIAPDLILSDFVYEAFDVAARKNIPAFGIAHFTWDWFFSKLYPRVLQDDLYDYFVSNAKKAKRIFFPPFTPTEILAQYKKTAVEVPFIIRKDILHRKWPKTDRLKILIMDSGAGLMANHIKLAMANMESSEWMFGVQSTLDLTGEGFMSIPTDHLLIDYVQDADLVIGRPGFNTLSECIAYRKPMLLISESMNPEMDFNVAALKKMRLGSFISLKDFRHNFESVLNSFLKFEFNMISENMNQHEFRTDGAHIIAKEILDAI
jgi:uncharacterized protein (TIGR00661 family)